MILSGIMINIWGNGAMGLLDMENLIAVVVEVFMVGILEMKI